MEANTVANLEEKKNSPSLEETFAQLDAMLGKLESRDITLEESFTLYQQGMELIKECNAKIDTIEKKMKIMNEEGELVDFQ